MIAQKRNSIVMITFSLLSFRLIKHTERLLEEKEDKLCIKVLQTLKEMMTVDIDYGEKVYNKVFLHFIPYFQQFFHTDLYTKACIK